MRPIPIETRKIIVAAKERGEKLKAIASWTGVSISSIYRICQLSQENMLEPKKYRGRQSVLTSENLEQIKKTVEVENDITLEELIEKLELPIKKSQLSRVLIRMGFSFKKRHSIPKNSCEKMSF